MGLNSINFGRFNWFNRITQAITIYFGRKSMIEPLNRFIDRYQVQVEHLSCPKLQMAKDKIKDGKSNMLLLAMSGMGKTRLVYEAFKEKESENAYYCAQSQGLDFMSDLTLFFQQDSHRNSLLILDNCQKDTISPAISLCNDHGMNTRIVFISNNYFDRPSISELEIVDFTSDDMRKEVNDYIEREIYQHDSDRFICDKIKEMADGYPQMGIMLVDAFKKRGRIEVNDVGILFDKILNKDDQNDKDRMNALKCLALFQPLGWRPPYQQQFEEVLKSIVLTGIRGDVNERREVFNRCINHFNGEIVEISSSWVNVRPLPLAIWLIGKWIGDHSVNILQVIDEFNQMPKLISAQLADAMYRRLRNMEGNEKATLMVQEIESRYENNPFGLGEVVCSELGSRLFLAFAYVNHQATTNCIGTVIAIKSIDELRNDVDGRARRNLVWALEKLCYPSDSFSKAALALAKLALAENEDISNNATGQLTQLFHILLPGTEASLEERLTLLKKMMKQQEIFAPILLNCLSNALLSGGFVKMGGAEEFALTQRKDYVPETEAEVTNYWMECSQLLVDYLELNPDSLSQVKEIVEDRSYQLLHKGRVVVVDRLVSSIFARHDGEWMEMYQHFVNAKKFFYTTYSDESKEIIDHWIEKLAPKDLFNELKEVRLKVFDDYKMPYGEQYKHAQTLMDPLADKFVSEQGYENEKTIRELIDDFEYFDFGFSKLILSKMDNGALQKMLDIIYQVIMSKDGDNIASPFLYQFCRNLYDKEPFDSFLSKLRESNKEQTYINLLANNEGKDLSSFHRIEKEIAQGEVDESAIVTYLNQVGYATPDTMLEMLRSSTVAKYAPTSEIVKYLERFQFSFDFSNCKDLNDAIKKLLLKYEFNEHQPSLNWNYSDYLVSFLEKDHDPEFAKAISHKMIELLNQNYTHSNFERIFPTLLNFYIDDIWEDFSRCLISEDYSLFFYQVKDVIGSGMSFGSGPLFLHGDERIKSLCVKHPNHAPYCIALMAPVFHYYEDDEGKVKQENRFSDIVLWLLEEYGNDKSTLDGLSGNMGSYSWVGSPVSLYQAQIACLRALLSNPKMSRKVKEWAQLSISDLQRQIDAEQSRLDYERMHYK